MPIRSNKIIKRIKVSDQSVARQSSDGHAAVGRLSIFFDFSGKSEFFFLKVAERSRNSRRRLRNRRLTGNNFFDVSSTYGKNLKKVAEQSRYNDRRSRDRRPTVKQLFSTSRYQARASASRCSLLRTT